MSVVSDRLDTNKERETKMKTIEAKVTKWDDKTYTYLFEYSEERLKEVLFFYRDLYSFGRIKDYQVLPA